jgi:hypothetical protein
VGFFVPVTGNFALRYVCSPITVFQEDSAHTVIGIISFIFPRRWYMATAIDPFDDKTIMASGNKPAGDSKMFIITLTLSYIIPAVLVAAALRS